MTDTKKVELEVLTSHLANLGVELILLMLTGKPSEYVTGYKDGYLEAISYITTGKKALERREKKNDKK